ncbi:MAG TPA: flagellar basal body-associated protein FliL [Methylovirgula sp.]
MTTRRLFLRFAVLLLAFAFVSPAFAKHHHDDDEGGGAPGLSGATILIIRHAEKPADKDTGGPGLAPAGQARAQGYADYFRHFQVDGVPVKIDTLIATADSDASARPRLTLTPLSKALGLPIQQNFADKEVKDLVRSLEDGPPGRTILIAWHHGKLPKLLEHLGADPDALIPGGDWPDDTYNWVIVLRYDKDGDLTLSQRVVEPASVCAECAEAH